MSENREHKVYKKKHLKMDKLSAERSEMYHVFFLETFLVSNSAESFGQVRKHLETQTQDSYNKISLSDKVF